jgi:hypothetical protein
VLLRQIRVHPTSSAESKLMESLGCGAVGTADDWAAARLSVRGAEAGECPRELALLTATGAEEGQEGEEEEEESEVEADPPAAALPAVAVTVGARRGTAAERQARAPSHSDCSTAIPMNRPYERPSTGV